MNWQLHGSRVKEILLFIILAWLHPTGSSLVLFGLVRNTFKPGLALCQSNFSPGLKFTHLLYTPMFPPWTSYLSFNLDSNSPGWLAICNLNFVSTGLFVCLQPWFATDSASRSLTIQLSGLSVSPVVLFYSSYIICFHAQLQVFRYNEMEIPRPYI